MQKVPGGIQMIKGLKPLHWAYRNTGYCFLPPLLAWRHLWQSLAWSSGVKKFPLQASKQLTPWSRRKRTMAGSSLTIAMWRTFSPVKKPWTDTTWLETKIRRITRPPLAIQKKLAASSIIHVWTYKKGPPSYLTRPQVEYQYFRQILWIFVESSLAILFINIIYVSNS